MVYKVAFYKENFNISVLEHDLVYCLEYVKLEPQVLKDNHLYNVCMNYQKLNVVNL